METPVRYYVSEGVKDDFLTDSDIIERLSGNRLTVTVRDTANRKVREATLEADQTQELRAFLKTCDNKEGWLCVSVVDGTSNEQRILSIENPDDI